MPERPDEDFIANLSEIAAENSVEPTLMRVVEKPKCAYCGEPTLSYVEIDGKDCAGNPVYERAYLCKQCLRKRRKNKRKSANARVGLLRC